MISAFGVEHLAKAEDKKSGNGANLAMVGTGAVGLQAAASHTNLANRWADREVRNQGAKLEQAKTSLASIKSTKAEAAGSRHERNLAENAAQSKVGELKRGMTQIGHRRAVRNRYLLGAGVVGGALAYTGLHRMAKPNPEDVAKATKREVTGGAAGATAGGAAYLGTGMFAVKPRAAEREVHENPEYRKTWNEHRKAVGAQGREAYKSYPLSLPGAKRQRFLARHMGGRAGDALMAGTMAAGAATGVAIAHHRNKVKAAEVASREPTAKSAFGVSHDLAKSAPAALTGTLYRMPRRAEFIRGATGGFKGHRMVHRMRGGPLGDVDAAYRRRVDIERSISPHKRSFSTGVNVGHAAAVASEHPEVTIPVAGAVVATPIIAAHHGRQDKKRAEARKARRTQKKETPVAKSAFGVEHQISKYVPGTITYQDQEAHMHSRKKNSGYRQVGAGAMVAGAGVAAQHPKVGEMVGMHAANIKHGKQAFRSDFPRWAKTAQEADVLTRKVGRGAIVGGAALAGIGVGRAAYHGHQQNKSVKRAQRARVERSAELERKQMGKSAFGVEEELAKFGGIGAALDMGRDALKGVKLGLNNQAMITPASAATNVGNKAGLGIRTGGMKLKPLVDTPEKKAVAGGAGLLTGGVMLGNGKSG